MDRRRRPGPLVPRHALARHRPDARRTRARGRRRCQPAEHVLRRLRQRRRLAIDRLRLQLGAALRRPVDRIDRRDRRRAVRIRTSSTSAPARASSVPTSRSATAIYKSTDAGKTWKHLGLRDSQMIAAIDVDPGNAEPALRRRARPSVRAERRARHLPLDRRRHARSRRCSTRTNTRAPTKCASIRAIRTSSTRRCGSSNRASSRARDSAAPARASSSPPTAARRGSSSPKGLPSILQANIAIAPSNPNMLYADRRAGDAGADRLLQVDRRRRALVPRRSAAPGAADGPAAGRAAARAHRRRRSADRHRRSEGSERRLQRVGRDVADEDGGADLDRRARRARRRRLSAHLDQPERHEHHPRRRRPGRGRLRRIAA